jgi:hypothetical protein
MAEINPTALGYELAILVGLAVQCSLLVFVIAIFLLARRWDPGGWVRMSLVLVLLLTPVAFGWVGYQCYRYRDYIRNLADDPVASTKLSAARASLRPTVLGSAALCVATVATGWAAARFGRRPERQRTD